MNTTRFPDPREAYNRALDFYEAYRKGDSDREYIAFSMFMAAAFIGEDGWIIDTGSFHDVNAELMERIAEKIQKHPRLWKRFFQVA